MKKIIVLIMMSLLTISCESEKIKKEFDDQQNLPSKIIFNEEYYEKTKNIFFIISDYQKNYSRLIEYNLENNEISTLIKDVTEDNCYINEFDSDSNYISFSIIDTNDSIKQEIYYYNIQTKKLSKIENYSITDYPGLYPISLNISNNQIVWLEHDFNNLKSYIKIFKIETNEISVIESEDFTTSGFKVPIFFVEFKDNHVFYDKNREDQQLKIYCYNTIKNSIINDFNVPEDTQLHFNGSYDSKNEYIALYAKTDQEDLIYKINMKNKEIQKLAGFHDNSIINDDIIESKQNNIYYTVQLNVSGMVKDHYYSEIYNLNNNRMTNYKTAFHIIKSENYLGLLKYDDYLNINKIHFELVKK